MNESKIPGAKRVAEAQPLPVPEVLNAIEQDNYTLDHYDISFGVTAIIPYYIGNESTDIITFNWGAVEPLSFPLGDKELPYAIDVTNDMSPDCLVAGTYTVSYTVEDQGGNISNSYSVDITVSDTSATDPTLPAPDVPAGDDDGWINNPDLLLGVPVIVSCEGLDAGNVITLFWQGYDENGHALKATSMSLQHVIEEGETSFTFSLAEPTFRPNHVGYQGTGEGYYTVTSEADAVLLSYTSTYNVDTLPPGE